MNTTANPFGTFNEVAARAAVRKAQKAQKTAADRAEKAADAAEDARQEAAFQQWRTECAASYAASAIN